MNFNDVPEGETAARAIVFSAVSCGAVHLSITAGPTVVGGPAGTAFGTFPSLGTSVAIPHISSTPPRGRLWLSYEGTSAGDVATGTVTVHCAETNQDFVVPIAANTIARPTVATMLVLDQSGSMDWLAGIDASTKRIDVLHQAAGTFVQLLQRYEGDAVGMVSRPQLLSGRASDAVHGRCVRPARGRTQSRPWHPRSDIDWCWRRSAETH